MLSPDERTQDATSPPAVKPPHAAAVPGNMARSFLRILVASLGFALVVTAMGSLTSSRSQATAAGVAPFTTAQLTGRQGQQGWFSSTTVTVALTPHSTGATHPLTFYRVLPAKGYVYYTRPFSVKGAGFHTVDYYSIQGSAREQVRAVTVRIDATPPTTAAAVLGVAPTATSWYNHPVKISLIAVDTGSGVAATYWQWYGQTGFRLYTAPITAANRGRNVVVFYSVDRAGNHGILRQVTVRIDRQPPSTTALINGAPLHSGAYLGRVTVALRATDDLSGVAVIHLTVDGKAQVYRHPIVLDRTGAHVITYYAVDAAGNAEPKHRLAIPLVAPAAPSTPTRVPTPTPIPPVTPTNGPTVIPTHTPIPVAVPALRASLSASSRAVGWGRLVRLTARVQPPIPGATAELRQLVSRPGQHWRTIRFATVSAAGTVNWTINSTVSASYEVMIANAVVSAPVRVHTYSVITLERVPSSLAGRIIMAGHAWPAVSGQTLILQRQGPHNSWTTAATALLQKNGTFTFIASWNNRSPTRWRALDPSNAGVLAGFSNIVTTTST